MKIYFDESGNTGCVINKENKLTFSTQPIFVIGAVLVDGSNDKKKLIKKYQKFKQQFCGMAIVYRLKEVNLKNMWTDWVQFSND